MTFDASQALRYAMDFGLATTSIIGVSPYAVYLVNIENGQISIDDTAGSRSVTETRLLIADGYRSYASTADGYLNPMLKQLDGQQLLISNGQLTANHLVLGPLVFPYNWNNFAGGVDATLFQPPIGANNNSAIYIQIRGPALSPFGNFFEVKHVIITKMHGLSYRLLLQSTSSNPRLF